MGLKCDISEMKTYKVMVFRGVLNYRSPDKILAT